MIFPFPCKEVSFIKISNLLFSISYYSLFGEHLMVMLLDMKYLVYCTVHKKEHSFCIEVRCENCHGNHYYSTGIMRRHFYLTSCDSRMVSTGLPAHVVDGDAGPHPTDPNQRHQLGSTLSSRLPGQQALAWPPSLPRGGQ